MRPLSPVPVELATRPFTRREALAAGITSRMLDHPRFVRVHHGVYRMADHPLDLGGRLAAARLALPPAARVSHMTRFALDGLELGRRLHFTVPGDLHLDLEGVVLHRTVRMPPCDARGVTPAAAFVQSASLLAPVELVGVGDWLMRRRLLTEADVRRAAERDPWRPGAEPAVRVLPMLDAASASLKESETRAIVAASGLEVPLANAPIEIDGVRVAVGDLVYRRWRLIVEYEGRQHAESIRQFARDIERYRRLRDAGWSYLQVTQERLARPRSLVLLIHRMLCERGYEGPPPSFGASWDRLFRRPTLLGRPRGGEPATDEAV